MESLENIINEKLGMSYMELFRFALNASNKYKTYSIPKKNGKRRTIHHPSKELKKYQRFLIKEVFENFPIHSNVFSYKKNISIKDLADKHKNNNYMLRIDFKNFFPSLKGEHIRKILIDNLHTFNLTTNDITLINLLVCRHNKLTIGAPTSPIISNILLFDFDKEMSNFSENITYSRYADDLYFSSNYPNTLKDIPIHLKEYLKEHFVNLEINHNKTISTSKKHKKSITGLVITSDNKVSIGRKQKRYIKSLIFKYINNNISTCELTYLKGYLSFIKSVENSFLINLENKYSKEIISQLKI